MTPFTTRPFVDPAFVAALGAGALTPDVTDVVDESRAWFDGGGAPAAVAWLSLADPERAVLRFHAAPAHRAAVLPEIVAWAEAPARRHPVLRAIGEPTPDAALDHLGFREVRRFVTLERPPSVPSPPARLVEGYAIRTVVPARDVPAWIDAYNDAFADHWGFEPLTPATYEAWLVDADYDPRRDLVAIDRAGAIAAFCYGSVARDASGGVTEGWIGLVGCRRSHRGRGLARALLARSVAAFDADRLPTRAEVDRENGSGAIDLFRSLGFRELHTRAIHDKPLG